MLDASDEICSPRRHYENSPPDPTPGNIQDWGPDVVAKIKGVVSLSGATVLGWRDNDPGQDLTKFIEDVENYTNTHAVEEWLYLHRLASPITLVANAARIPPVLLFATDGDPMPYQQAEIMFTALHDRDPTQDIQEYTMPGSSLHCFNYWHVVNPLITPPKCVSQQVIDFLNAHKNDP